LGIINSIKLFVLLIFAGSLLILQSCKKKTLAETGYPVEIIVKGLDPEKLTKFLFAKVSDPNYKPVGLFDERFQDTLKQFYLARNGNPVWLNALKDSVFRIHLQELILGMEAHGLKPKFYNLTLIEQNFKKLDKLKSIESDEDYNLLTDMDYLLSISVMSIYHDLALGRIDPYSFYKPSYNLPFSRGRSYNIFSVLQNPYSYRDSILVRTPSSRRYHSLQIMYQKQSEYLKNKEILEIDTSQELNSEFNLKVIDQRMEILWSSMDESLKNTTQITSNRDEFIRKTQLLYGLPAKGLDSIFVNILCGPSEKIIDNSLASLERERWFSVPDTGAFVLVNLNEFVVYMHNDSVKSMKVCVGKSKPLNYDTRYKDYLKTKNYKAKPINSETPQIGSAVSEVIINPTWTVPNSIIGKEMYSQIVSNPNYLTRKGFEVVRDGKVVSPSSINWKAYKPYGIPVKIRQKAGPSNSLGRLKFNFPNPHNIYMHDTPEKGRFSQNNRAVSHGCIRLNYPTAMAEFLLGLQGDSTLVDKFRLKMGMQPYDTALQIADSLLKPIKKTETIRLKRTIPVYLDYRTILIEKDGSIRFVKDIYRRNEAIAKKLKG